MILLIKKSAHIISIFQALFVTFSWSTSFILVKWGLAESGRVFTETENKNIWHSNFGGGIWISYLDRTFNIVSTVAKSNESLLFYFGFSSIF